MFSSPMVTRSSAQSGVVRLADSIQQNFGAFREQLIEATVKETGFVVTDSELLVDSIPQVARFFLDSPAHLSSQSSAGSALVQLHETGYGGVAVVLPRNAAPYLAVLTALSALSSGNRVWLKFPTACSESAEILRFFFGSGLPDSLVISSASGSEFVNWALESDEIGLIHFIGDSEVGAQYLSSAFDRGKQILIDGNGNCQVYVSEHAHIESIMPTILMSALRYNGQTCTSLNGIIAHPKVFDELTRGCQKGLKLVKVGDPMDRGSEVGTLFSEQSVEFHERLAKESGGDVTCFGQHEGKTFYPTLVIEPELDSQLVTEGAFAPLFWIRKGTYEDFGTTWNRNKYPLCAGIFSGDPHEIEEATRLRFLARLTVNKETSDEHPMEPWGAYGKSGNGPVQEWTNRYRRVVQVDTCG